MAKAWLLNLDAELELVRPTGYYPSRATLRACQRFETVAMQLLDVDDVVLKDRAQPGAQRLRGFTAAAWCPTPSALRALAKAGATLPEAPPLSCLQRVNHRRFHVELGQTLPGAVFADTIEAAQAALSQPPSGGWMVKRGFGFAGRAVRRFPLVPSPDDRRWLTQALTWGGVQLEPWLPITHEYSLHGHVDQSGRLQVGVPCLLIDRTQSLYTRLDSAYLGVRPDAKLLAAEESALGREAERVGRSLHAAGYFGPFGVDAFAYVVGKLRHFNARSEINARYTLAYATGMGIGAAGGFSNRTAQLW